ncbi:MAG: hypothetical protein L7W43_06070, partial [Rubripirellula sp.]|nr:hypothetical protein [Rubripirellula sp.]
AKAARTVTHYHGLSPIGNPPKFWPIHDLLFRNSIIDVVVRFVDAKHGLVHALLSNHVTALGIVD